MVTPPAAAARWAQREVPPRISRGIARSRRQGAAGAAACAAAAAAPPVGLGPPRARGAASSAAWVWQPPLCTPCCLMLPPVPSPSCHQAGAWRQPFFMVWPPGAPRSSFSLVGCCPAGRPPACWGRWLAQGAWPSWRPPLPIWAPAGRRRRPAAAASGAAAAAPPPAVGPCGADAGGGQAGSSLGDSAAGSAGGSAGESPEEP